MPDAQQYHEKTLKEFDRQLFGQGDVPGVLLVLVLRALIATVLFLLSTNNSKED